MIGGFESLLFTTVSRPALGPIQPPIQWVPGALSPGVKRPGREADHSQSERTVVVLRFMWDNPFHIPWMKWKLSPQFAKNDRTQEVEFLPRVSPVPLKTPYNQPSLTFTTVFSDETSSSYAIPTFLAIILDTELRFYRTFSCCSQLQGVFSYCWRYSSGIADGWLSRRCANLRR
jgi:hypothetical protein